MQNLPDSLYSAASVRKLDSTAIEQFGIPGYTLMQHAGRALFNRLREHFPACESIAVICGAGNNAGDGYIVAALARDAGFRVRVASLVSPHQLKGDALQAFNDWIATGGDVGHDVEAALVGVDVVVDALLGTGLQRPLVGDWLAAVEAINRQHAPVIAVDIPSGLSADTGWALGNAVRADLTVSFIGLKQGLFTGQARDFCGRILFDNLQIPDEVYERVRAQARLLQWKHLKGLPNRSRSSHKGEYGHVLVVGGDYGMAGAARLAGEAALRAGAGLVSVVTRSAHVSALVAARPELMVFGVEDGVIPGDLLKRVSVIAIGPGLGRDGWGRALLAQVLEASLPVVLDADGLNRLVECKQYRDDWILTPHPGEAARLLMCDVSAIERDRFAAVKRLQTAYGGVIVLKGAGTLVAGDSDLPAACPYGNPGMASGGMGDVLTGVLAGLVAQGLPLSEAAFLGVALHARAADSAAEASGERGLLASDLYPYIRALGNWRDDD